MTDKKVVITISRQFGSGGADIGALLAKDLGINLYDKSILRMTSDESGIKESYFHIADEKAGNRLLYRIIGSMAPEISRPSFGSDLVSADNLFRFQSNVIRRLATEESCIIIGRCANYVLDGREDLIRIHLNASFELRKKRVAAMNLYLPNELDKNIKRIDRERRDYYRYYTGRSWDNPEDYDLVIHTDKTGITGTVRLIENYLQILGYDLDRDFPSNTLGGKTAET